VTALRERVAEMREPPLGLDVVPDTHLEMFFDEILAAPMTAELLTGLYEKALPALRVGLKSHIRDTNVLVDNPSVRVCKFALIEIEEMIGFGIRAIDALNAKPQAGTEWSQLLDDCLAAAGGLDGTSNPIIKQLRRIHSAKPYVYDKTPKRDERFPDPYNQGVNAEVFLYDEKFPARAKTLMLYFKRLREIDVPEMMASIIHETRGKPWRFYRDMSRQLWDEARHAMMGEIGFAKLGIDWAKFVMVNHTWALNLNTQLNAQERHAVLYFIEQGLMPKTGKRYEWEVATASEDPLCKTFQDYDWADEVLHSKIGREWYITQFANAKEAIEYGDKCWSRILSDWRTNKEKGLTQHRNWWPELYREACKRWGISPDPAALAYNTSYEVVRPDLKEISVSG
jgi:hypothetical protein